MKQPTLKGATIPELERGYDKVHAWFFAYPQEEVTLSELSSNAGISKTTANAVVTQLANEGFLEYRILGKVWRIRARQGHSYFMTRKIPFNLRQVYESGLLDWLGANIPQARASILFGSYRKGDDVDGSDLDIAVEIVGEQPLKIVQLVIKSFGYRRNVKVNVHLFSRKQVDVNLFANIANGIVLSGFLEVMP
ncbi:hypothetical protein HY642_01380 [Candidatus Woesearchaeota archaeon]|nr:hypothetical protein [Candidatus Woesearchaeota archaeon]